MEVAVNNLYPTLKNSETSVQAVCSVLQQSADYRLEGEELSVVFVDDAQIALIHSQFMDDPTPTDVITFPADQEMDSAGEIIISVDHAQARHMEHSTTFDGELLLYLIHGWLHLVGFDDRDNASRAQMRQAEIDACRLIASQNVQTTFMLSPK